MSQLKSRADHAPDDEASHAIVAQHGERVESEVYRIAAELGAALNMPPASAYSTLLAELFARAKRQAPAAVMDADGRSAKWRVRVRLYDAKRPDEPEADPDARADAPGSIVIAGLPEVAVYLGQLAINFHGQQCLGLDQATLLHRLKSLRPTLSRRGGNAAWRVPYSISQGDWLARVDVERVRTASAREATA